jgi:CRISPR/Cas system-associated protein endoribonuclease Cas2
MKLRKIEQQMIRMILLDAAPVDTKRMHTVRVFPRSLMIRGYFVVMAHISAFKAYN